MSGVHTIAESAAVSTEASASPPDLRPIHLAHAALAAAVAGIEFIATSAGDDKPELTALLYGRSGVTAFPRQAWLARPGSVMTASGMELKGRLNFSQADARKRILPLELDEALLGESTGYSLTSSKLTLERPSPSLKGGVLTIVGAQVNHLPRYRQPELEPINGEAGPEAFEGLLALLTAISHGTADYTSFKVHLGHLPPTHPTEAFTAHFSFDQNLGVPADTVAIAEQNFTALAPVTGIAL